MTALLLGLKASEAGHEHPWPREFSYPAVITAVASEWAIDDGDAREALGNWVAGRGEVHANAKPPVLTIYRDSWEKLRLGRSS